MQSFDVVTARAVADMRVLTELTLPFIRPNGCLAVAKGANPQVQLVKLSTMSRCIQYN